jgi:hypothetical protein
MKTMPRHRDREVYHAQRQTILSATTPLFASLDAVVKLCFAIEKWLIYIR